MTAYLVLHQGVARVRLHDGELKLERFHNEGLEVIDIAIVSGGPHGHGRSIDVVCHDEGLYKHQDGRHGYEMPTLVRPTDGCPLFGPLVICACTRAGAHVALRESEYDPIVRGLVALGWRVQR